MQPDPNLIARLVCTGGNLIACSSILGHRVAGDAKDGRCSACGKMMKARATRSNNRRRPQWSSALVSLFVALSLMVLSTQLCALMESLPGHAHTDGHSHAAAFSRHDSHDGQAPGATHYGDHSHDGATHHATSQPVPDAHECCSAMNAPPVIAAAVSRLSAPDRHSAPAAFALAVPSSPLDIFALTNCHGRDGPPDESLHSQLGRASLLGRAPPVSV